MSVTHYTIENIATATWVEIRHTQPASSFATSSTGFRQGTPFKPLQPLRQWLDQIQISDRKLAHWLCKAIPAQCPFERDIKLFGHTLFHIPPMCKLNPLYEEVVGLRFRALCYLADECGVDVTQYC